MSERIERMIEEAEAEQGELSAAYKANLEAARADHAKPSILDMVGILGDDWTGGLGSVDYVRQQREGRHE